MSDACPPSRKSPDALLHAGTPSLSFENNWGLGRPENVQVTDSPTEKYRDIWDFIVRELKAAAP